MQYISKHTPVCKVPGHDTACEGIELEGMHCHFGSRPMSASLHRVLLSDSPWTGKWIGLPVGPDCAAPTLTRPRQHLADSATGVRGRQSQTKHRNKRIDRYPEGPTRIAEPGGPLDLSSEVMTYLLRKYRFRCPIAKDELMLQHLASTGFDMSTDEVQLLRKGCCVTRGVNQRDLSDS
jgi:hypothetical protein